MDAPTNGYRYDAFISYRHVEPDRKMAKWLHSVLETYRVPAKLVREKSLPRRLNRVFRDEEELAASSDLSREIDEALTQSRYLIVVCSPRTPASEWVNAEVVRFRQLNRDNRIIALLVEGEPRDSFPRSLCEIRRAVVDSNGITTEAIDEIEPLAADIRPQSTESRGHVFRMAQLRILACLLGCRFDELRRREQERQTRRLMAAGGFLAILLLVMTGLTVFAFSAKREADYQRGLVGKANTQLAKSNTDLEKANASERTAKEDADQKRIDAEKARDETKQAFDFLVAAFRKSDPSQDGEKLTVAELFDQAAEGLEKTFPNKPLIQAQLLNAIGQTFFGLGLFQKAVAVHERARVLRQKELGGDHEETLASMNNLAVAYFSARRLTEALPLLEQTLELRKAQFGPEHPDTLMAMTTLATMYRSAGRLAEALVLHEQTVEKMKAKFGPEEPATLNSMNNLAMTYATVGRLAEALQLWEQTLGPMKAKLGREHPDTLRIMNNLAMAYQAAGRPVEALPLFEEMLELKKIKLGLGHPSMFLSMGNLALAYLEDNQPEKALPLFGQFIAGQRTQAMPDDPTFAGLLAAVSLDLLKHRQFAPAQTYLRECLTIREKRLPNDWELFHTKSLLGTALAGQKKFQEAEPFLVEGYSGMKEREAAIPVAEKDNLPEAIRRLVDLYDAWNKKDKADEWRLKLPAQKESE